MAFSATGFLFLFLMRFQLQCGVSLEACRQQEPGILVRGLCVRQQLSHQGGKAQFTLVGGHHGGCPFSRCL